MNELVLVEDADLRTRRYVEGVSAQSVYPSPVAAPGRLQPSRHFEVEC